MSIERGPASAAASGQRQAFRGAAWSLAAQAVMALGALITFVVMSRSVGHAELGEYLLAVVGLAAVQWLAFNAYREPVIQAPVLTPAMCNSAFWFSAGIAVLLAAALTAAAHWLHWHGTLATTASCLSVMAIKVFFDALSSVPQALCYRELRFPLVARLNMLATACGLAASIGLLNAGWGVLAVAAGQSLISALGFVSVLACGKWRPGWHFAWRDLGFLRRYSPHVMLWQGVETLNMHLDRFIVGTRLGTQALGIYGFGRRLNDVIIEVLAGAVGNVALPSYARVQQDPPRLKLAYLASVRMVTFGVFPVIGILYGIADELVIAVFGGEWAAAVPVYKCFLLLGAIQAIGILQASLIRSLGHANLWARYQVAQAAANIAVLGLVVDYGIYALAVAVVIRTYAFWGYAVVMTCRLIDMRVSSYLGLFVKPALCAVLACVVAHGILHLAYDVPQVAMIAGATLIAGMAYLGAALLMMRQVTDDVLALIARRG